MEDPEASRSSSPADDRPWVARPPLLHPPPAEEVVYVVYPAVVAPAALAVIALAAAIVFSWWWLAAIPFIWIGSICAEPNLNLAAGCLTYLSAGAGWFLLHSHPPLGIAIMTGAIAGYILSFVEKTIRMHPVRDDEQSPADSPAP